MLRQDYNKVILERIEKHFDKVLPLAALISFLTAFVVYSSDTPVHYVFYDMTMAVILLVVFLFRKQLSIKVKIVAVVISVFLLGLAAVINVGFSGTGITLIIIANILAVAFLDFKRSRIFSAVSLASIALIWALVQFGLLDYGGYYIFFLSSGGDWLIHMASLTIVFIALHMVFWTIKSYLIENIFKLENSMEETYNLAYYDQLTGLPNRYMFNQELLNRSEVHNINGYLVLFDLKGFKLINSIYGNDLGDEILSKIAKIFEELKGDKEMVARISGNEYAWWMEGMNNKTLDYRLEYLKEQFYIRLKSLGISKKIEFHVCFAHFPTDGDSIEGVYQRATMAMEYAKSLGHASVVKYNEDLEKITRDNEHIREMLLDAIEERRFEMAYQEKIDARTGQVIGVEALARWRSEEGEWIPPSVFIPIIERGKLSVSFGDVILQTVLDDYEAIKKVYGDNIHVSINISPTYMSSKGFKVIVMEEISRRGYKPSAFMLEITEEVMIEDMDIIAEVMEPLRDYGVGISLDDFGTGYSSLNYLSQIEIDELKVDKSFIDQIGQSEKITALLNAIIRLTDDYGIEIIAEGVETKEQCDLLLALGCHRIQGYYFSKPTFIRDMKRDMKRG